MSKYTVKFEWESPKGTEHEVTVEVSHDPGVWAYSNGDPGYPEDWQTDIISVEPEISDEEYDILSEYIDEIDDDTLAYDNSIEYYEKGQLIFPDEDDYYNDEDYLS